MAQTIILTAGAEVNTNWKEYSSSQFTLFTGHGPSTTTNTSIFARVSCSIRWNKSTDRFEIKNIQLQYKKSNTVHSTPIIITMGGAMTFTNYYAKNNSINPTGNVSLMLSQIPEDSWKTIKTFISSGNAEINKGTRSTCSISNLQVSINGFSGGTKIIDLPIEIRTETPSKTTVTYTFNGNGGKIDGQNTFTTTATVGTMIRIAPAAKRSNESGSGNYTATFNPDNGSSKFDIKCKYPTEITWSSGGYSRTDNKSITARAGDQFYSLNTDDKNKDHTWDAIWDSDEKATGPGSSNSWPSDPTKFGYKFIGWFNSSGTQITRLNNITSDITLTAKWTPLNYKIKYKHNTVKNAVFFPDATEVDKTFGKNVNITSAQPAAFGYTFKGWGTASECLYLAGTISVDDKIVKNLGRVQDIELYAHWEPINDTVKTYNYSVTNSLDEKTFTYNIVNKSYVVPEPATRSGNWVFLGWYYEQGSQAPYTVIPRTKTKQEFWGNTSVADSMGDKNFAWGTFKNPDIVEDLTSGSIVSPMYLDTIKNKQLTEWNSIKSGNIQDYNVLNKKVWGWEWHLYGFWTISGKFIKVGTKDDSEWKKVKSAYVKVINKDGEEDWKYISDLSMVTEIRGSRTPIWKKEVYK